VTRPPGNPRQPRHAHTVVVVVACAGMLISGMLVSGLLVASTGLTAWAAGTTTTTPSSVEISAGFAFRGAVITGAGAAPRRLTAYQSAVFMQAWIGDAFFGKPKHEKLPAHVAVYRLDVSGTWGGGSEFTTRAVYYASDGTRAWIAFPSPQITPPTGAPARLDWFVGPPRLIQAFAGTAKLIPTVGTGASPPNAAAPAAPAGHSDGSAVWPWIVGAAAAVTAVGGGLGWRRRRLGASRRPGTGAVP
jgi:hypothetical protein